MDFKQKDLYDSDYHLLEISNWAIRDLMLAAFTVGATVVGVIWFLMS